MNILIVSATGFEISPITKEMNFISGENEHLRKFFYNRNNIDILVTGIGIPFTTYRLALTLFENHYDLAINAGIAGSFKEGIRIGQVVHVISEQFADIGIEDKGKFASIFEMKLYDKNRFPFKDGVLYNESGFSNDTLNNLVKTSGITVNKTSGNSETINKFQDMYSPGIETMEGAAFFYVCLMEKLPFIQIRSISNKVEERDTSKWNIEPAVDNLNKTLREIIDDFNLIKKEVYYENKDN